MFYKLFKNIHWGKDIIFNKLCSPNCIAMCTKVNLDSSPSLCTKSNSKDLHTNLITQFLQRRKGMHLNLQVEEREFWTGHNWTDIKNNWQIGLWNSEEHHHLCDETSWKLGEIFKILSAIHYGFFFFFLM